jgi:hypothetical protein
MPPVDRIISSGVTDVSRATARASGDARRIAALARTLPYLDVSPLRFLASEFFANAKIRSLQRRLAFRH